MSTDAHDDHDPPLPHTGDPMPPIDFTTFVWSLSHAALVHMGLAPMPDGSPNVADLPGARQHIDILLMLQEKTKGNLTGAEERLLHQVLLDLRMRFIDVAKKR